jgi:hypothetical protein
MFAVFSPQIQSVDQLSPVGYVLARVSSIADARMHHQVPPKLPSPGWDSMTAVKIYTLFSGSVASFL